MLKLNSLSGFGSGVSAGAVGAGGWHCGGSGSDQVTDRTVFSTSINAAVTTANLLNGHRAHGALSNAVTAGYIIGSDEPAAYDSEKLTYATEVTTTQTSANVSQERRMGGAGVTNNTNGYWCGGYHDAGGNVVTGDKLVFSTETLAAEASANLPSAKRNHGCCSYPSTHGYFLGGYTTARINLTDKLVYSTDTTAAQTSVNLTLSVNSPRGISDQSTYGYVLGGQSDAQIESAADRIVFAADTLAVKTTADLDSEAKSGGGTFSDGTTNGYHAGGEGAGTSSKADMLVFASETTSAQTSANLSVGNRPTSMSSIAH